MATLDSRFDELIDRSGGCWLWLGPIGSRGYGHFYMGRKDGKKGRVVGAHRYAWERANRPLLPGEVVRHSCDNPPCVRPDHLAAGSQGDNLRDAARKGRLSGSVHGKGTQHRFARLAEADVHEIRRLAATGATKTSIAKRFGMSQPAVSRIVNGKRWGHLDAAA